MGNRRRALRRRFSRRERRFFAQMLQLCVDGAVRAAGLSEFKEKEGNPMRTDIIYTVAVFGSAALFTSSAFADKNYDTSLAALLFGQGGSALLVNSYGTGFELGEGFTPAWVGGQAGWSTFSSSTAEAHIDTLNAMTGDQHLRISLDPTLDGGSNVGAFSPDLGSQNTAASYMSIWLNIGDIGGADYDVVPQAPDQGFLSARVKFSWLGDILILDDPGGGLTFVDSGLDYTPGVYQHLEIALDNNANTIDYYLDGAQFYSSASGVFAGTSFDQVVLLSDNWNFGESGDFDDLFYENIPAPSALALLGLAGLFGRRRRR
ncbi:MAG: hypothetical protein ACYTEY_02035 [Planctomycetota bacterium]